MLAHPALELYALGSDSLAGQPAGTLDPAARPERLEPHPAVHHERGSARVRRRRHVRLPLARGGRGARRHRLAASSSISPARIASSDAGVYADVVRVRAPARRRRSPSWSYGLPELSPPSGRLVANPGCYATAVLLALAPIAGEIEPTGVVVDAKSGMTGAGRRSARVVARRSRARERHAVPRRRAPARAGDRRAARLSR